jgi:hypothetical protein
LERESPSDGGTGGADADYFDDENARRNVKLPGAAG